MSSRTHHRTPQPHPDPALLTTEQSPSNNVIDDTSKVNVVSRDFKEDPSSTYTSDVYVSEDAESELIDTGRVGKGKGNKRLQEAQAEGTYLWEVTKHYLLRPGVAGGLVGLGEAELFQISMLVDDFKVNIGLLSSVGYAFYTKPDIRRNISVIGSVAAGTLLLIGTESYAAEKYRETPRGRQEEQRAREEGMLLYKRFHEHIFRPGVLGGLVGLGQRRTYLLDY